MTEKVTEDLLTVINLSIDMLLKKKIGRKLKKGEVVHHKDRNKLNNSSYNLWVFANQKEHDRIHKIDAKRHGKKVSYKGFEKEENSGCMLVFLFIVIFSTYNLL